MLDTLKMHEADDILCGSIILYSKAGEPGQIQQAVSSWLKSKASTGATGSVGLVFELYILHVLLPLGLYAEAEKEIKDTTLLTVQQKESVLEVVLRKRPKLLEQELAESRSQVPAECSERRQSGNPQFLSHIAVS